MPDALVERDDHLMVVTMNRPHRYNAMSGAMLVRMYDAFAEASDDPDVRCIVLTGAGGNFSSGADLKAMAAPMPLPAPVTIVTRPAKPNWSRALTGA